MSTASEIADMMDVGLEKQSIRNGYLYHALDARRTGGKTTKDTEGVASCSSTETPFNSVGEHDGYGPIKRHDPASVRRYSCNIEICKMDER